MKDLPNILTFARLALAPYLFLLLWRRQWDAALIVILLAGITDGLDGFLARKLKSASRWGEALDPIADKVLLSGSFLTLALNGSIEVWLAALVLGRDALLLLAAGVVLVFSKKMRRFPPSMWGKSCTVAQIVFVVMVVGQAQAPLPALAKWIAASLTVLSGLDYARRYTQT